MSRVWLAQTTQWGYRDNKPVTPGEGSLASGIRVRAGAGGAASSEYQFDRDFRIGRSSSCDVQIDDEHVSRVHAAVELRKGQWSIRDLGSSNGIYLKNERVQAAEIETSATISLGIEGPRVSFEILPGDAGPGAAGDETQWLQRHLAEIPAGHVVGEETMMIRKALKRVQRRHRWQYAVVIALLAVLVLGATGYALSLRRQLRSNLRLARDLFYSMKSIDLDIARAEQNLSLSGNAQSQETVRAYRQKRERLEEDYNRFLTALNVYDARLSPRDRLILRVTRIFGESELEMPSDFVSEVSRYIAKWQSSGRYSRAVALARQNGYDRAIGRELLAMDLPPQFFYLAMQESDFDQYTSGPPTRKGIAKGMWQFIPETAVRYGLKIGPLADVRRPDPSDDRDHFDLATKAAARYIKDLYSTDAEASGLLVMACYNWGDDRVLPLVRAMPDNPRDRNFWNLLTKHRSSIPQETYDYVFYIFSAAVIGENPRLFGFEFDNPLNPVVGIE